MEMPTPITRHYQDFFTYISDGRIKIPQFQRDFVWDKDQTAKLIDSILKGYPIGTFIFWKTRERLKSIKNIGEATLPDPPEGDSVLYVLDGQQRITSLFAVRYGIRLVVDRKEIDYKAIWIDLDQEEGADDAIVISNLIDGRTYISVHDLLSQGIAYFSEKYDPKYHNRLDMYRGRLTNYPFSTIELAESPVEVACDVFTRINTTGKELTLFEIMVAKTYDEREDFDLAKEYNWLIKNDSSKKNLDDVGFESVPASTVLQCTAGFLSGQVRAREILHIPKAEFIQEWPNVRKGIFSAVDFLRDKLSVPVSGLLPYPALITVFAYFFMKNEFRQPDSTQVKMLRQYFWWASISNRFSSGAENKMAQDLKRMALVLKGDAPDYKTEMVVPKIEEIRWRNFSTSDAYCKAILCLYAEFHPKSFADNSPIRLDNQWLIQANSKNYHHFFPKDFLKRIGVEEWKWNSILNITFMAAHLNKGFIKAKAPSEYIGDFEGQNTDISEALKSHLIIDKEKFGVMTNDYDTFIERRAEVVLTELNERLNPDL